MSPKHTAQWLRNAFDAHDRDNFERALVHVQAQLERLPPGDCTRGSACVCPAGSARDLCTYRRPPPQTALAPCVRGPACSCTTLEKRLTCGNASAQPRGAL